MMNRRFSKQLGCAILLVAVAASAPTWAAAAASSVAASPAAADAALRDFIDAASYRLTLADQVALTKWDSRKPIEDAPREKVVIDAAVEKAAALGEPAHRVAAVFKDQIEANKLVQYRLLAQWERAGGAPAIPRPNLVLDIRPTLDKLQTRLIDGLLHTRALSAQSDCPRQVALAVDGYVREKNVDTLHAMALDRAMARLCEQ